MQRGASFNLDAVKAEMAKRMQQAEPQRRARANNAMPFTRAARKGRAFFVIPIRSQLQRKRRTCRIISRRIVTLLTIIIR